MDILAHAWQTNVSMYLESIEYIESMNRDNHRSDV